MGGPTSGPQIGQHVITIQLLSRPVVGFVRRARGQRVQVLCVSLFCAINIVCCCSPWSVQKVKVHHFASGLAATVCVLYLGLYSKSRSIISRLVWRRQLLSFTLACSENQGPSFRVCFGGDKVCNVTDSKPMSHTIVSASNIGPPGRIKTRFPSVKLQNRPLGRMSAGRREGPIVRLSRLGAGRNQARKVDFQPGTCKIRDGG